MRKEHEMTKTRIDWCDMSWNPVTGCLGDCPYCYARRVARRFGRPGIVPEGDAPPLHIVEGRRAETPFPFGFEPTFHRYRLGEPAGVRKHRTVFVGSMCDLFGDWIPDEWIREVLDACRAAPWHRYIFLTKNPGRFSRLGEDAFRGIEAWIGTTVTRPGELDRLVSLSESWMMGLKWFVSVEPLLEPFEGDRAELLTAMDWVIVGAETGNRRERVRPSREWIGRIDELCRYTGTPLFMKESLRTLMGDGFRQEFPWKGGGSA